MTARDCLAGRPVDSAQMDEPVEIFVNFQNGLGLPGNLYDLPADLVQWLFLLQDNVTGMIEAMPEGQQPPG